MHGIPYVFDDFEPRLDQNVRILKHRHQMDQYWSVGDENVADRKLKFTAFDRRHSRLKRSLGGPIRGHIKIAFFGNI